MPEGQDATTAGIKKWQLLQRDLLTAAEACTRLCHIWHSSDAVV